MNITIDGKVWRVRELAIHGASHVLLVRDGAGGHRIVRLHGACDPLTRLDNCIAWLESILGDWRSK